MVSKSFPVPLAAIGLCRRRGLVSLSDADTGCSSQKILNSSSVAPTKQKKMKRKTLAAFTQRKAKIYSCKGYLHFPALLGRRTFYMQSSTSALSTNIVTDQTLGITWWRWLALGIFYLYPILNMILKATNFIHIPCMLTIAYLPLVL